MIPDFRYWIDNRTDTAVSILFDKQEKAHFFVVSVKEATQEFSSDTLDGAIHKISLRAFMMETDS